MPMTLQLPEKAVIREFTSGHKYTCNNSGNGGDRYTNSQEYQHLILSEASSDSWKMIQKDTYTLNVFVSWLKLNMQKWINLWHATQYVQKSCVTLKLL